MHAANLLNKRRQQREEHIQKAVPTPPEQHRDRESHRHVSRKTNSQTSFLDSIGAAACSTPTSSTPRIPTISETSQPQYVRSPQGMGQGHTQGNQQQGNGCYLDGYYHADPAVVLYHKPERISCAHIGLCVMIVGTIVTIIAGFICYLLGFGEPGVIIGCGGGIITVVGLVLLCCGNRWHLDERTLRKKIPIIESLSFSGRSDDPESGSLRRTGRVGDKLEVSKIPKLSSPPDSTSKATVTATGKARLSGGLFVPVLEIDMISEPEPSRNTADTEAEKFIID